MIGLRSQLSYIMSSILHRDQTTQRNPISKANCSAFGEGSSFTNRGVSTGHRKCTDSIWPLRADERAGSRKAEHRPCLRLLLPCTGSALPLGPCPRVNRLATPPAGQLALTQLPINHPVQDLSIDVKNVSLASPCIAGSHGAESAQGARARGLNQDRA